MLINCLSRIKILVLLGGGLIVGFTDLHAATPTPTPVILRALPVEKTKSPGFFQRIFKKKATPTPAPTPAATPTPRPKSTRKKSNPTASVANTPSETAAAESPTPNAGLAPLPDVSPLPIVEIPQNPGADPDSTPLPTSLPPLVAGSVQNTESTETPINPAASPVAALPTATPLPPGIRDNPLNQPIPLVEDSMGLQITPATTPVPKDLEKTRLQFQKVKAKALEDPKLQSLKEKTEIAGTPSERYAAFKEYYPSLFSSMRKIDESLLVEIDEMEAASRRRLDRMKLEELPQTPAN